MKSHITKETHIRDLKGSAGTYWGGQSTEGAVDKTHRSVQRAIACLATRSPPQAVYNTAPDSLSYCKFVESFVGFRSNLFNLIYRRKV